jgi:hypothetical protein
MGIMGGTGRAVLIVVVIVALLGAGTSLAFAGWSLPEIAGFLATAAAVISPMMVNIYKTDTVHQIVNSQRSEDSDYRKLLADTMREGGMVVPDQKDGTPQGK